MLRLRGDTKTPGERDAELAELKRLLAELKSVKAETFADGYVTPEQAERALSFLLPLAFKLDPGLASEMAGQPKPSPGPAASHQPHSGATGS